MIRISYALWSMSVVWPLTLSHVLGWVSVLKLTVLEDYLEFCSGTGTVEKLCVWSFTCLALYALVRGRHLPFWDKRVGEAEFSENSRICSDIWHVKWLGISSSELGSAPYWVCDISRTCSRSGNVSEVIGSFIGCLGAPELEFSTFCSVILWRIQWCVSKNAKSYHIPLYDPRDDCEPVGTFDRSRIGCETRNLWNKHYWSLFEFWRLEPLTGGKRGGEGPEHQKWAFC